jgi:hypothetical protein
MGQPARPKVVPSGPPAQPDRPKPKQSFLSLVRALPSAAAASKPVCTPPPSPILSVTPPALPTNQYIPIPLKQTVSPPEERALEPERPATSEQSLLSKRPDQPSASSPSEMKTQLILPCEEPNFHPSLVCDATKHIQASTGPYAPIVCIEGPHGSGKSFCARKIALNLRRVPIYVNGQLADDKQSLCNEFDGACYAPNGLMVIEDLDEYQGELHDRFSWLTDWVKEKVQFIPPSKVKGKAKAKSRVCFGRLNPIVVTFTDRYGSPVYRWLKSFKPEVTVLMCEPLTKSQTMSLVQTHWARTGTEPHRYDYYENPTKTLANLSFVGTGRTVSDIDRLRIDRFQSYNRVTHPNSDTLESYRTTWDLGDDRLRADVYGNSCCPFNHDDQASLSDTWSLTDVQLRDATVEQQYEHTAFRNEAFIQSLHRLRQTNPIVLAGRMVLSMSSLYFTPSSMDEHRAPFQADTTVMTEILPFVRIMRDLEKKRASCIAPADQYAVLKKLAIQVRRSWKVDPEQPSDPKTPVGRINPDDAPHAAALLARCTFKPFEQSGDS